LTTIFIIHQCGLFCVASTAQPGAERAGNLQFCNAEEVTAQKKQGHLKNIRISNGNVSQIPANAMWALAVEYFNIYVISKPSYTTMFAKSNK